MCSVPLTQNVLYHGLKGDLCVLTLICEPSILRYSIKLLSSNTLSVFGDHFLWRKGWTAPWLWLPRGFPWVGWPVLGAAPYIPKAGPLSLCWATLRDLERSQCSSTIGNQTREVLSHWRLFLPVLKLVTVHSLGGKVGFSQVSMGVIYGGNNSCGTSTRFEVQL